VNLNVLPSILNWWDKQAQLSAKSKVKYNHFLLRDLYRTLVGFDPALIEPGKPTTTNIPALAFLRDEVTKYGRLDPTCITKVSSNQLYCLLFKIAAFDGSQNTLGGIFDLNRDNVRTGFFVADASNGVLEYQATTYPRKLKLIVTLSDGNQTVCNENIWVNRKERLVQLLGPTNANCANVSVI
jgi:hypothetical protein